MKDKYTENARIFKAFCDENRLRILEMLQTGEKCACRLLEELHISQPTLSHHMKILAEAEIVESRKDGKWTYYKISQQGSQKALSVLKAITKLPADYKSDCCK